MGFFGVNKYIYGALFLLLVSTACDSKVTPSNKSIIYTKINTCTETVENANAAFSELDCGRVGQYTAAISVQAPTFFTVGLTKDGQTRYSEFEQLSGELPLEPGAALEWHMAGGEPKFMVFRLAWGTQDDPFSVTEYLLINYVASDRICPIAKVKVAAKANEKVHALIAQQYANVANCPEQVADH